MAGHSQRAAPSMCALRGSVSPQTPLLFFPPLQTPPGSARCCAAWLGLGGCGQEERLQSEPCTFLPFLMGSSGVVAAACLWCHPSALEGVWNSSLSPSAAQHIPLCPPRCLLTPGCHHYKSHSFKFLLVWCQPGALGMLCPLLGTAHSEALL